MSDERWDERVRSSISGVTRLIVADASGAGGAGGVAAGGGGGGGGGLVGLAAGIPEDGRARVVAMWVDPRWRGQGLAAAIIEKVCDWAAAAGYAEIQIETVPGNDRARRLYERLGFRPTDLPKPPGCDTVLVRPLRPPLA
jgi:GNAT superfamily N-acetyltransferase